MFTTVDVETDHRLLKATVYAPSTRNERKRYCNNPSQPKKRLDIKKLQDKNIQERFTATLNEQLRACKMENADTSTRSQNLIDVISKTAFEILPEKQKQVNTNSNLDDEYLNELLDSRSGELKGSDTYKSLTKKIKKHVRYLRNNRLLREAEQINSHATRRETEELFRLTKNDSTIRSIKKTKKCEPEKLKTFFQTFQRSSSK